MFTTTKTQNLLQVISKNIECEIDQNLSVTVNTIFNFVIKLESFFNIQQSF